MIILGIDPGSRFTGYGIIRCSGNSSALLDYGVIRTLDKPDQGGRLKAIYDGVDRLIRKHAPDECALEMPVYGKNPQSMLKLGRAQAAAMLAAMNHGLTVTEYTPKEIKKSVTGNGNAAKEQVRFMVRTVLSLPADHPVLQLDASDALAISICHSHRASHGSTSEESYRGWEAFINANPGRVR